MKLYFGHQTCALAPHIIALEAELAISIARVDMKTKIVEGRDYHAINPKGCVPALALDDGRVITENAAVQQYLADLRPEAGLAPPNGSFERVRLQEALSYFGTDIHHGYKPLFNPALPLDERVRRNGLMRASYALLDQALAGKTYLLGEQFSCADAYLFTLTRWAPMVKLDLAAFANLQAFMGRVATRPAVLAAMKAQGLLS